MSCNSGDARESSRPRPAINPAVQNMDRIRPQEAKGYQRRSTRSPSSKWFATLSYKQEGNAFPNTALYPPCLFVKKVEFETANPHTAGFWSQKCLLSIAFYCLAAFKVEGQFASVKTSFSILAASCKPLHGNQLCWLPFSLSDLQKPNYCYFRWLYKATVCRLCVFSDWDRFLQKVKTISSYCTRLRNG